MLLNVQKYIQDNGLDSLERDLGIVITRYDDRIVLNYSMLDSPKFHPVCDECRGLILSWPELNILCRPFNRFYNYGEGDFFTEDEFNLNRMICSSKIDGSLINIYHDGNDWCCATRKRAFAEGETAKSNTFKDVVDRAFPEWQDKMDTFSREFTYIYEVVSPETRVVVPYDDYYIYLLAMRSNVNGDFLDVKAVDDVAKVLGVYRPKRYKFNNLDEIVKSSKELEPMDEEGEGYVCFDHKTDNKVKIKNPSYLAIAHMRENGAISNKRIAKLVFERDYEEYLNLFPEDIEFFDPYIQAFYNMMEDLMKMWNENKDIEDQKEFALNVKDHKLASILFQLRKGLALEDMFDKLHDKKKQELLEHYKN